MRNSRQTALFLLSIQRTASATIATCMWAHAMCVFCTHNYGLSHRAVNACSVVEWTITHNSTQLIACNTFSLIHHHDNDVQLGPQTIRATTLTCSRRKSLCACATRMVTCLFASDWNKQTCSGYSGGSMWVQIMGTGAIGNALDVQWIGCRKFEMCPVGVNKSTCFSVYKSNCAHLDELQVRITIWEQDGSLIWLEHTFFFKHEWSKTCVQVHKACLPHAIIWPYLRRELSHE